jgi:hypothetical protein
MTYQEKTTVHDHFVVACLIGHECRIPASTDHEELMRRAPGYTRDELDTIMSNLLSIGLVIYDKPKDHPWSVDCYNLRNSKQEPTENDIDNAIKEYKRRRSEPIGKLM